MPNQTEAKYTKQLGPMVEPDFAAELEAWAKVKGISVSSLTREMLERDLRLQRGGWEEQLDAKGQRAWKTAYTAALARTRRQGQKHVTRRRAADDARAGRTTNTPSTVDI